MKSLTFNDKLKEAKAEFDAIVLKKWDKKSMPEVKAYNLEYRKVSEKYPYNQAIKDYILSKETVDGDLIDYLGTEIFLSQHDIRADEDNKYKQKMLAEGWLTLSHDTAYRGKIEYIATKTNDWLTSKLSNNGTLTETVIRVEKGGTRITELFLIPKGKRSRGYYVRNLDQTFYKPLTK